jgi:hypothetical protein
MENNPATLISFSILFLGLAILAFAAPTWAIANFYRWTWFIYKKMGQEYPANLEVDYQLLVNNPEAYSQKYSLQMKMFKLNGVIFLLLFLFGICLFTTK